MQKGDSVAQALLQKPDNSACISIDDVDDDVEVAEAKPLNDESQLPRAANNRRQKTNIPTRQ